MQYMPLIYGDLKLEPAYGTPEFEAMMGGFFALNEQMKADKVLVSGEGLQGVETATSVKLRAGRVETMDGRSPRRANILAATMSLTCLISTARCAMPRWCRRPLGHR